MEDHTKYQNIHGNERISKIHLPQSIDNIQIFRKTKQSSQNNQDHVKKTQEPTLIKNETI